MTINLVDNLRTFNTVIISFVYNRRRCLYW